jgi:hypothetical protein
VQVRREMEHMFGASSDAGQKALETQMNAD